MNSATVNYCAHCGRGCSCGIQVVVGQIQHVDFPESAGMWVGSIGPLNLRPFEVIIVPFKEFGYVVEDASEKFQNFADLCKEVEEQSVDRLEQIADMRAAWSSPKNIPVPSACKSLSRKKLHSRRLLFSHSGWIGRAGRQKRGQK